MSGFNELCSEYYENVYKYIYILIGDRDVAFDIVQDVFMNVCKNMHILADHENPGGYIFKTAKNLARNYKRSLYKRIMREISIDEGGIMPVDNNSGPERIIDKEINEYDYIDEALSCLDDKKLQLYKMYYIQKKTMKDIARETGIEYTALRMQYVRLRKEIRQKVKEIAEKNFVT